MSAEVETMFSVEADNIRDYGKKTPWHDLGMVVNEKLNSQDALIEAGLDWDVVPVPVFHEVMVGGQSIKIEIPNMYSNSRSTDGRSLGIVGNRYHALQNRNAFRFGDDLVDSGEAKWASAGSLYDGSRVWMLMELPIDVQIAGMESETIKPYILISNSHDGKSAITAAVTGVRVVCKNTQAIAISEAKESGRIIPIRHTKSMDTKLGEARRVLQIAHTYYAGLEKIGNQMIETSFSNSDWVNLLDAMIPSVDAEDSKRGATISENRRQTLTGIYNGAEDLENIRGTAWGALQAVIDFSDHCSVQRTSTNAAADTRMNRIVSGGGMVQNAYAYLAPLAGISA